MSCRILGREIRCSYLHFPKKGQVGLSVKVAGQEGGTYVRGIFFMKRMGLPGLSDLLNGGRRTTQSNSCEGGPVAHYMRRVAGFVGKRMSFVLACILRQP